MMDEEAAPELSAALRGRSTFAPADRITEMLRPRDPFVTAGMAALQSYGSGQSFGDVYGRAQAQDTQRAEAVRRLLMGERQMAQQDTANQLAMARLVQQQTEAAAQQGNRQATLLRETVNSLTDDPQERAQLYTYAGQNRDKLDEGNLQTALGQYAAQAGLKGKARGGNNEFEGLLADLPEADQKRLRAARAESLARGQAGTNVTVTNAADSPFLKGVGDQAAKDLAQTRESAQSAAQLLGATREAKALLDKGVLTGAGAGLELQLGRLLNAAGFNYREGAVENTQAFIAAMGQNVLALVKSLGAGTSISNADRDFAEKIAGGNIALDEKAIRRIIDIHERAAQASIKRYNTLRGELEKVPGAANVLPFYPTIDANPAPPRSPPPPGGPPAPNADPLGLR